jgi:hypothetical protein
MSLAERFDRFANWCVGSSPLYEQLAHGVAADEELLDIARTVPSGRSPPHVLLGAVHAGLLGGAEHSLTTFYPSVNARPTSVADRDPVPPFREFCLEYENYLQPILESRRTQTNAVRRCTALLPAFEFVSQLADGKPLALIELGASAGLNLLFDRYGYEYGGRSVGNRESALQLTAEIRGEQEPPIPDEFPRVVSRVGIDLNPLDATDPEDARWLRALIWPEHTHRRRNLERTIDIAGENPPDLRRGDAITGLSELVSEVPDNVPVCVFDTQLRYQLSKERIEQLEKALAEIGTRHELYWLSGNRASPNHEHGILLELGQVIDGQPVVEPIATYDQHGAWIEWLAG